MNPNVNQMEIWLRGPGWLSRGCGRTFRVLPPGAHGIMKPFNPVNLNGFWILVVILSLFSGYFIFRDQTMRTIT